MFQSTAAVKLCVRHEDLHFYDGTLQSAWQPLFSISKPQVFFPVGAIHSIVLDVLFCHWCIFVLSDLTWFGFWHVSLFGFLLV